MDTDASFDGIGAVLSQCDEHGKEHVIAFASRVLSKVERNYSVTIKELLALVTFMSHFCPYLLGRDFKLRTDHAALSWLLSFKDPSGQLARWLEKIHEYSFSIIHRKGKLHSNADAMSRLPSGIQECGEAVIAINSTTLITTPNDIRSKQLSDPNIGPVLQALKDNQPLPSNILQAGSIELRHLAQIRG